MRVLLLDLDSTRADHLGCYGYHRDTTPNIDRIAKEGVRFTNYYTTDAPCAPSRNALMTGRFGIHTGNIGHGGTAGDMRTEGIEREFHDRLKSDSFPAIFRRNGMKTALISPFAERHSSWQFYAGFTEMYNTGKTGDESAEEVTPTVLDWLERNGDKDDWFLYVNYWDPHTPYRAPKDYGNPFENEPLPAWLTEDVLKEHLQSIGPHSAREINMYDNFENPSFPRHPGEITDMAGLRRVIDGYDTGLHYMDEHIGEIFKQMDNANILEDTVVIITADHGENLGELGIYAEHGTADQMTCRLPMIIRWPGLQANHVDNGLHYHLDLLPTIADLLEQEHRPTWDGQSYASILRNGKSADRTFLVFSQNAHVCQRAVRFDKWLYIRTYHDGFHLFDKEMLFDIVNDPHEQHNLSEKRRDLCKEAVYILNQWHDDMMFSMNYDTDPMWTVIKEGGPYHAKTEDLIRYLSHLRRTGRSDGAEQLEQKYQKDLASKGFLFRNS
ncbi:sulfatase family protein [Gracilibacillus salinarum]|uniref:Sulfatase n=1 Tax=Gracilibacillus salinarum TaxID=2932255 RepID=A0ABY4GPJ5_9BACI|nr:sulfatase [Gracilibacillus salinarum]UOQ86308.1 sulfatase [Gracilibacillus salinarum]